MCIDITVPKNYPRRKLVRKTKQYIAKSKGLTAGSTFFAIKGYYVWIKRTGMQLMIAEKTPENINEIKKYLEFLFHGTYIGISGEGTKEINLELDDVKCFKI